MATKDLANAIKCSGYAGTSGQTFRNNVLGAASGAYLKRDYSISTWAGWGSNMPFGSGGPALASGTVVDLSTQILGGSRISYITRQGSGLLTIDRIGGAGTGGNAILQSSSVSGGSGVNTAPTVLASVELISNYNAGATPSLVAGTAMSTDGVHDDGAPSSGYGYMHFFVNISGGNGVSDGNSDLLTFYLNFQPNTGTGNFNDTLSTQFSALMTHRGYNPSDFTFEWHSNSSYTAPVTGGASFFLYEGSYAPGGPPNPYSLWMRYMVPGGSTWINYGEVDCYDGRISY